MTSEINIKEVKKLSADFLNRTAQILFAMVLVGPFVTGNLKQGAAISGITSMAVSFFSALWIVSTIKKGD